MPSARPIPLPSGFLASGVCCGLRRDPSHPDLGLLLSKTPRPGAALFTRNRLLGAHVHLCRDHLRRSGGIVRAVLVNARNANCATGERGIEDARGICAELADRLGCPIEQVLMFSTGPIGAPLPVEKIRPRLDDLLSAARADGAMDFARAIMTTDTVPKARTAAIEGGAPGARLTGFAKGSGMIHPDMATMLAFEISDSAPDGGLLPIARRVADRSFHRVSIDGDTSPNDSFLLWAGGSRCADDAFERAATEVARSLARSIAADGEGASRLITVRVLGARSEDDAVLVGRTIATSPLVKTAVAGRDPNWGRILSAAGRCGVPFDPGRARVRIGEAEVYASGVPFPTAEALAHAHLAERREVVLEIDLGCGASRADVFTCDLTGDYVRINADYRT